MRQIFDDLFLLKLILRFVLLHDDFIFHLGELRFQFVHTAFCRCVQNALLDCFQDICKRLFNGVPLIRENGQHRSVVHPFFVYLDYLVCDCGNAVRRSEYLHRRVKDRLLQFLFRHDILFADVHFLAPHALIIVFDCSVFRSAAVALQTLSAVTAYQFTCLRKWTIGLFASSLIS